MNKSHHSRSEKLNDPFLFQGDQTTKGYFEGWYYKQVNAMRGQTISVIFGVSMHVAHTHSFVQLLQTNPLRTYYFEYPIDEFGYADGTFRIGPNRFSKQGITLDLHQDDLNCTGSLTYTKLTALKTSFYMPSIMGPFAYIPDMECNHGVVSMRHQVDGTLELNNESWSFQKDTGYIEKDWGRSFPKRYIWIQGNHFAKSEANLMLSVADIPFLKMNFEGVIAQLDIPGKSLRIATYFGGRKGKLERSKDGFTLELIQGEYRLQVIAKVDETGDLKAPVQGSMHATIKEGLGGTIIVRLTKGEKILWEDSSGHCGIEIEGYA
ncbi:MAG: tocopherol cyclase family protein [Erysipelotrichaceae bacterium]